MDVREHQMTYALWGAVLGMGAPLGALAGRLLFFSSGDWAQRLAREWSSASVFYVYMAVGTVIVFALFGFVLGRKSDVLQRQNTRANTLAITDGLTGLYNHRYLHEHLSAEVLRAHRYGTPLTCLMLDIDNFKLVNDTHGHPYGDEVLRVIARIIREQVRRVDTAGRYGGEEFLILMPHTTSREALPVAERIRAEVQEYPFRCQGQNVRVTVSVGMATYDSENALFAEKKEFLKAADEALYDAKHRGKNRTRLWEPKTARL